MIKKKPVEEIQTESAKKSVVMQHKKFGRTIGINSCFGSSDLGQMTGAIPRKIVKEIPGTFMRCPLALWDEIEGPSQVLLYDDYQVTIDGCKERCLKRTLEKANVKVDLSYALDEDFGLEKKQGPDYDEETMLKMAEKIKADIMNLVLSKNK